MRFAGNLSGFRSDVGVTDATPIALKMTSTKKGRQNLRKSDVIWLSYTWVRLRFKRHLGAELFLHQLIGLNHSSHSRTKYETGLSIIWWEGKTGNSFS